MKQVFKYASLLFVAGALLVTSCKKKSDDAVTPAETTPTCTGGSIKSLTYDVSALHPEGTGPTQENGSVTVSKCDGSYNIVIKADNDENLDYMYILQSTDGGKKTAVKLGDVKDGNGNTWTGNSSSYTLKAPTTSGADKMKFTLSINIPVRSVENGTDAYEVWFTKATGLGNGRFAKPDAKRDIGPILASFNYGSVKYNTTTFTATVGSQLNSLPSYIVTSGTGGTFTKDEIIAGDSTLEFPTVNMLFFVLNSTTPPYELGTTTPALISPDKKASVKSRIFTTNGSTTTFALYTGSFTSAGETELKALAPTESIIPIEAGKVYSFKTTNSKTGKVSVGLAKINSITGTTGDRTAEITFKVLNVTLASSL